MPKVPECSPTGRTANVRWRFWKHIRERERHEVQAARDGPRKWTQAKTVSKGYSFQNSEGEESKRQLWGGEWPGSRVDPSVSEVKVISDSCDRFSKLQL